MYSKVIQLHTRNNYFFQILSPYRLLQRIDIVFCAVQQALVSWCLSVLFSLWTHMYIHIFLNLYHVL